MSRSALSAAAADPLIDTTSQGAHNRAPAFRIRHTIWELVALACSGWTHGAFAADPRPRPTRRALSGVPLRCRLVHLGGVGPCRLGQARGLDAGGSPHLRYTRAHSGVRSSSLALGLTCAPPTESQPAGTARHSPAPLSLKSCAPTWRVRPRLVNASGLTAEVRFLVLDRSCWPSVATLARRVSNSGRRRQLQGIAAVIVNFNSGADLVACVDALRAQLPAKSILVVDNDSSDSSLEMATSRYADLRVVRSPHNLGFGGGANFGALYCGADKMLFLNPDVIVMPECLDRLAMAFASGVGVVGPQVQVVGGGPPDFGGRIDLVGMPGAASSRELPLFVSGCCLATTRQCFDVVGGFDERYFLFMEDVEYCWQALRRGFDVRVALGAVVEHRGGGSMPGGYVRGGRFEVTAARIVLRERNTLAMLLACGPASVLPVLVAGSVLRTGAFATLLALHRRWSAVWALAFGVALNVVWAPATGRRRWRSGVTRAGAREGWRRVHRRLYLWDYLSRRWEISFVDSAGGSPPEARGAD